MEYEELPKKIDVKVYIRIVSSLQETLQNEVSKIVSKSSQ